MYVIEKHQPHQKPDSFRRLEFQFLHLNLFLKRFFLLQ